MRNSLIAALLASALTLSACSRNASDEAVANDGIPAEGGAEGASDVVPAEGGSEGASDAVPAEGGSEGAADAVPAEGGSEGHSDVPLNAANSSAPSEGH
jgi:hypothetical protein